MDGSDPSCSNWLRFINCARNEEEQNMEAYQYHGEIYYLTFKAVYPGNELMVWYGEQYAEELGISVEYRRKGQRERERKGGREGEGQKMRTIWKEQKQAEGKGRERKEK